ncbi:MAG: hypothetical protein KKH98_08490 [Spirochaetes bacterium]|nr:hypothetical protein [Spirochaetota bacterium]
MKGFINKKVLFFTIIFLLITSFVQAQPSTNYGVHGSFSNISRRLLLKQGILNSAGTIDADSNAIPVGDGTYYFLKNLIQGAEYNFIFQANVNNTWQYEQIPNKGSFPASVDNPSGVTEKKGGTITRMVDDNVRRKITVPTSGSIYYVFCNYGHHPNPPSLEAIPQDSEVLLKVRSQGRWGYIEPDVEYGGWFSIFRSITDKGPYTFLTNLYARSGSTVLYTNRGLANETTYYYTVLAYDSYGGTNAIIRRGPFDKEVDIPDYNSYIDQENIDANMYSGYSAQSTVIPHQAIKVIFKVEHIDWDIVKEKNFLVYLTPDEEDGRTYWNKIPARIIKTRTGVNKKDD